MKLSRIGVLALVISALTAAAAVADEQHVDGKYRGHTDGKFFTRNAQGEGHYRRAKVTFIATDTRIKRIRFEVRVTCPDGTHFSTVSKHGGSIPIEFDGHFVGSASNDPSGRDVFKGRIVDNRASGRLRRTIGISGHGTCASGSVEWKAVHVSE
jgi:hypothetical protein